jgi:ComEC/Rec2-related protein
MTYKKINQIKRMFLILILILIIQQNFTIIKNTRKWPFFLIRTNSEQEFFENKSQTKDIAKMGKIDVKFHLTNTHFFSVFTQEMHYFKEIQNASASSWNRRLSNINQLVKGLLATSKSIIYSSFFSLKYRFFDLQNQALIMREKLAWILEENFSTREATLGKAFVFADLSGAPESIYHSFKVIGILHLIAASSANIYLILSFFKPLLAFLEHFFGQKLVFFAKSLLIITYFLLINGHFNLVDSSPSILRAALSCLLVILANHYLNLSVKPLNLLLSIAILCLLINPFYLQSLAFQLSFLASFIILFYWPFIKKKIAKSSIMFSITVQFCMWPLLIFYFANINLIAIPANIVIAPLVEWLTVGYFIFIASQLLHLHFLADFVTRMIYFANNIFFNILAYLETLPAKSIVIDTNKSLIITSLIAIQLLLVFWIYRQQKHTNLKNKYRILAKWLRA